LSKIRGDEIDSKLADMLRLNYKTTERFGTFARGEKRGNAIEATWGDVQSLIAPRSSGNPSATHLHDPTINYWVARLWQEHGGLHDSGAWREPHIPDPSGSLCFVASYLWHYIEKAKSSTDMATSDQWTIDLHQDPAMKRIMRRLDYMQHVRRAIFPISVPGHWLAVTVDFPQGETPGRVQVFDSAFCEHRAEYVLATFRAWMRTVHSDGEAIGAPEAARERFSPLRFTEASPATNQQQNGDDCGVFAIMAMAAAAQGDAPGTSGTEWDFTQQDVPRARAWMMQSMYLDSMASGSCTHTGLCAFS